MKPIAVSTELISGGKGTVSTVLIPTATRASLTFSPLLTISRNKSRVSCIGYHWFGSIDSRPYFLRTGCSSSARIFWTYEDIADPSTCALGEVATKVTATYSDITSLLG